MRQLSRDHITFYPWEPSSLKIFKLYNQPLLYNVVIHPWSNRSLLNVHYPYVYNKNEVMFFILIMKYWQFVIDQKNVFGHMWQFVYIGVAMIIV